MDAPEGEAEPTKYLNLHASHLLHHLLALARPRHGEQLELCELVHAVESAGGHATRARFRAECTSEADHFEREILEG